MPSASAQPALVLPPEGSRWEALVERLAELSVAFAANVQTGQTLVIGAEPGQESLVRAVARSAYRHGARFVDTDYFDPHVKRARIEYADPDTLSFVPSWHRERALALGDQRCSSIALIGDVTPRLLNDLDPELVARCEFPAFPEELRVINKQTVNWTAIPCPTEGWARLVHTDDEAETALGRLWADVAFTCRLDEADPARAWRERAAELAAVAEALTQARLDEIRLQAAGTDLRIGLFPTSTWQTAWLKTVDGLPHMANFPSEEVFSVPDPSRVEGELTISQPLIVRQNLVVGLTLTFRGGRVCDLRAEEGDDIMRAVIATDEGAARFGEVALVDAESRVAHLGRRFLNPLLDENASSHVALGDAYGFAVGDEAERRRVNSSRIHQDLMLGATAIDVTGRTRRGNRISIMTGGKWTIW